MGPEIPPLQDLLDPLRAITDLEVVDVEAPLNELGVDSVDVLEWIFMIEEILGTDLDDLMEQFSELESFGDLTLAELYGSIVAFVHGDRVQSAAEGGADAER